MNNSNYKIILLILLMFSWASAQFSNGLENKLKQLNNRLIKVERLATKYNNQKAVNIIIKARDNYEKAKEFLKGRKIFRARQKFAESLKLVNLAEKILLFKPAARLSGELDRLLHRAELVVQKSNNTEARYMLTKANAYRQRAHQDYESGRYIRGQEYYRIAVYFANKSINLSRAVQRGANGAADFETQFRNIENFFNDIYQSIQDNSEAKTLLSKARTFLRKSKDFYEKGELQQAFLQLQMGERLLYRAIDLSQNTVSGRKESINANLNSLRLYIDGIEASLVGIDNNRAVNLLNKAKTYYRGAEKDFQQNNFKAAQNKIFLAQRMATSAMQFASPQQDVDQERVSQRIDEIESLLRLQKDNIDFDNNETLRYFHQEAGDLIQGARLALSQGNTMKAFRRLQLAIRLLNRIESLRNNTETEYADKDQLIQWNNRLHALLDRLKEKNNQQIQTMVPVLEQLQAKVEENLNNNRLAIAGEILNILQNQVNLLLKEAVN